MEIKHWQMDMVPSDCTIWRLKGITTSGISDRNHLFQTKQSRPSVCQNARTTEKYMDCGCQYIMVTAGDPAGIANQHSVIWKRSLMEPHRSWKASGQWPNKGLNSNLLVNSRLVSREGGRP